MGSYLNFKVLAYAVIFVFALFTLMSAILVSTGWRPKRKVETKKAEILLGITAGNAPGLVTGFTGRGGRSMVVPVLLLSGMDPKASAATSSFIITMSVISALLGHLPQARFPPDAHNRPLHCHPLRLPDRLPHNGKEDEAQRHQGSLLHPADPCGPVAPERRVYALYEALKG